MNPTEKQPNESGPKVMEFDIVHITNNQIKQNKAGKFDGPRCFVCSEPIVQGQSYFWLKSDKFSKRHTTCARKSAGTKLDVLTEDEQRQKLKETGAMGVKSGREGKIIHSPKGL